MKLTNKFLVALATLALTVTACAGGGSEPSAETSEEQATGEPQPTAEEVSATQAEDFPEGPVDLVVGFGAGGALDLVARALAENMPEEVPITVLNREGAGGTIAASEVVRSDADGQTAYLAATTIMTAQPHQNPDVAYQGPATYRPVLKVVYFPQVFAITPNQPYATVEEMIDYAKENPGEIRVGTGGEGTLGHLTLESLKSQADIDLTHVPFSGFSEAVPALVGEQVDAIIVTPADIISQVEAGNVKALAVFSEERSDALPDTPTFSEDGVAFTQDNYYFVIVPKDVPDDKAQILHDAFKAAIETEAFQEFANTNGAVVDYAGPEDLMGLLQSDYDKFGTLVEELGLS